jgi:hypothetical protein
MNSTIIKKKKICSSCSRLSYIFSKGKCKECSIIDSTTKRVKKHEEQEEDESLRNLIDDLDALFSKYTRMKDADSKGIVHCVTCLDKGHYTDFDAGHYIPRTHLSTRWETNNVKPQCRSCNRSKYGEEKKFAEYLEKEHSGITEYLKEQSKIISKPTREELKSLITEYRVKVNTLKHKFK